jgi:hypothetical protein
MATFDERIDRPAVVEIGQTREAAAAAYELARALEFTGASWETQNALNAYWRAVKADV